MWPALAAVGSFLLPGTGQALTGDRLRTVLWAVAGIVLVIGCLWLPQLVVARMVLGVASAVDAVIVVRRARRASIAMDLVAGSASLIGQIAVLLVLRLLVIESFVPQSTSMVPTVQIGDHVFVDKLTPRFAGYHRGEVVVFTHPLLGTAYLKRIAAVGGDEVAVRDGVLYVNGHAAAQTLVGDATYWDRIDEREGWNERKAIAYREDLDGTLHTIYRAPQLPSEATYQHDYPRTGEDEVCGVSRSVLPQLQGQAPAVDAPAMKPSRDGTACLVPAGTYFMLGDSRDNSVDSRYWGAVPAGLMIGRVVGIWWTSNPHVDKLGRIGRIE